MQTETAIVPVLCGTDDRAFRMTSEAHKRDIFVLPVVSPAVPRIAPARDGDRCSPAGRTAARPCSPKLGKVGT
jgi:hypothetical protein